MKPKGELNMKKILLLLASFFVVTGGISQENFSLPHPEMPPLPESAVFRQFAGYTPSLSTGTVNIPIPLYDIEVKNFTLPISLQYYTTGIKVSDPATPLGYGWILNPGLRITRTVRGRPDGGVFENKIYNPGSTGIDENEYTFYYGRNAHIVEPQSRSAADKAISAFLIDPEYDIFTVHLPDENATFIYQKNKMEKIVSSNPLIKIKPVTESIGLLIGFEVTDGKGIVYHFGCKKGEAYSNQPYLEQSRHVPNGTFTGWGLREISLPDSEHKIRINWIKANTRAFISYPTDYCAWYIDNKSPAYDIEAGWVPEVYKNTNFTESESVEAIRMQEIVFPAGRVNFTYEDYKNNSVLTKVSVTNHSGKNRKIVDFEYQKEGNTLLLNSLKFSDEGEYRFTYNSNRFLNFLGQDYWGYYNGQSNSELTPNFMVGMELVHSSHTEIHKKLIGTAVREPYEAAAKANILERIDYPTGGYTVFEYELHQFEEKKPTLATNKEALNKGRGLRISKITTKDNLTGTTEEKVYTYRKAVVDCDNTLDSFFKSYCITYTPPGGYTTVGRKVEVSAYSFLAGLFSCNAPVFYTEVEEVATTVDKGNSRIPAYKTKYEFKQYHTDGISFAPRPHIGNRSVFDGNNHVLTQKTIYRKQQLDYLPVEVTSYKYTALYQDLQETYIDFNLINSEYYGPHFNTPDDINRLRGNNVPAMPYFIQNTWLKLARFIPESETKTVYTENGEITSNTTYTPNYSFPTLIAQKEYDSSNGDTIREEYKYMTLNGLYGSKKGYSYPISETRIVNGQTMSKKALYNTNRFHPSCVLLEKNSSQASRTEYESYDVFGNPLSVTTNGIRTNYLWSYNGMYLIAEIRNADKADIQAAIQSAFSVPTADDLSRLDMPTQIQLKNFREHLVLKNALITTYTYIPLIGIESFTNTQGYITTYEYDKENRLYRIKDQEGNIVQEYIYNYGNKHETAL